VLATWNVSTSRPATVSAAPSIDVADFGGRSRHPCRRFSFSASPVDHERPGAEAVGHDDRAIGATIIVFAAHASPHPRLQRRVARDGL